MWMHVVPRRGTIVGATYKVPMSSMSPASLDTEKKLLTLQAKSFGKPPPPFEAFLETEDYLHVPRFYGLQRFGAPEIDERTSGAEISIRFTGTLNDMQEKAKSKILGSHLRTASGGAILVLPCGFGKTVTAINIIATLGKKTLVIVHKSIIRDQWIASFEKFCPGTKVGIVQGQTWNVEDCDVVVCMIMTLAKNEEFDVNTFRDFGTVVVDEAHHIAAPVMNRALTKLSARFVLGLSATIERSDGLTPLLHWCMGPEGFRVERDGGEGVKVSIAIMRDTCAVITDRKGAPIVSLMVNELVKNHQRNLFLVRRTLQYHRNGRSVILLSDRLQHLNTLWTLLLQFGVEDEQIGMLKGTTKEGDRRNQLNKNIVLCTYPMAAEGIDKAEADTCIFATPKGKVEQCVGRIQRPCTTKKAPLVLDIVDDVGPFRKFRWMRQRLYSKERYEMQVKDVANAEEAFWFA